MTSVPRQSDVEPGLEPRTDQPAKLRFGGRTGIGKQIVVYEVGDWLDVVFQDRDGERRGFSLNPSYTALLAEALVAVLSERAQIARVTPGSAR